MFEPAIATMKLTLTRSLAIFAAVTLADWAAFRPATAVSFDQQEVDQSQFIAIARPYGENKYDLLLLQQIPGQRQCWSESGSNPTVVEPLLLNFDFTGSCERSTDSNGYSIRIDGQDYGLNYLLRVVERQGELILVGTHRSNPSQPEVVVGRTAGLAAGFLKINLDPGWRFTKRAYGGKVLGHVYLTGESSALQPPATASQSEATPSPEAEPVREITFSATPPPSPSATVLPDSKNEAAQPSPSLPLPPSPPQPPTATGTGNEMTSPTPPPSPSATASFSDLPPLPPPPQAYSSPVVPPPPVSSSSNQRSLSDVLTVAPRPLGSGRGEPSSTGDRVPVPDAPLPVRAGGYRVMAAAKDGSQQTQMRSLYPDAFPSSYQGKSMWQVGVFSSRENAEKALESLEKIGLEGLIVR